jgi:ribosomal protein L24
MTANTKAFRIYFIIHMIKKGDNVLILQDHHKGIKGTVEKVLKAENKVIVAGVNIHKKVIKARMRGEKHTLVEQLFQSIFRMFH